MNRNCRLCLTFLALGTFSTIAFSQETADKKDSPEVKEPEKPASKSDAPAVAAATQEQLDQWVKDLVDPKFMIRQAASQKLIEAGSSGMQAVAKAADSKDLELATRCLAVLTDGLSTKDETSRKAAFDALQALSKSENKSVAQRAQQALETPLGPLPGGVAGPRRARGFPGAMANNIAVRVQVNNGVRETNINENGKVIVIKDTNNKDITVTITEVVNGNKQVTAAAGKDLDELKKNNADAHAYFEKYCSGKGNGIRLQLGGNPLGGPAGLIVPQPGRRILRPLNPFKAGELFEEVETLRLKIEDANSRLLKLAEAQQPDPAELKKISEEIKASTKRLGEIKSEAESR